MLGVLESTGLIGKASFTFPLRTNKALDSLDQVLYLVYLSTKEGGPAPTVTLWTGSSDLIDRNRLDDFIKVVGKQRVFVDLPFSLETDSGAHQSLSNAVATLACVFLYYFVV